MELNLVIGATVLGSAVAGFDQVSKLCSGLGGVLSKSAAEATKLGRALELGREMKELTTRQDGVNASSDDLARKLAEVTAAYEKAAKAAGVYGKSLDEIEREQKKQQRLARLSMGIGNVVSGVKTMAPGASALSLKTVRSAISFESAMADAAKTIDGMRDDTGKLTEKYSEMGKAVQEMGRSIPLSHAEIAALFAAGGQQGMTDVKELQQFATMAAHMSVAFGMGTQEAADAIGGYRTAMGLSMEQTRTMLDLMNQFANTTSASEAGIADIVRRIGSLGGVAGVQNKELTAMAATLDSMKIAPEVAATSLKNFFLALASGGSASKKQKEAFKSIGLEAAEMAKAMQSDAPAAILRVLEALRQLPKEAQLATMKDIFGKESLGGITPLLDQLDLLRSNLAKTKDEQAYMGAMQQEFENRNATTASNLTLFNNQLAEISTTLGQSVLPVINDLLKSVRPLLDGIATFFRENPGFSKAIVEVGGALAGFGAAAVALAPVWGLGKALYGTFQSLTSAAGLLISPLGKVVGKMADVKNIAGAASSKVGALKTALAAPVGTLPLVAALGTLVTALWGIGKALDTVTDKMLGAGSAAKLNALDDKAHAATGDGRGLQDMSDAEVVDLALDGAATGGVVTEPTPLLVGEGKEPEAILPLSRLSSMLQGSAMAGDRSSALLSRLDSMLEGLRPAGGAQGSSATAMNVTFSPVIHMGQGAGQPQEDVRGALRLSMEEFKKMLASSRMREGRVSFA